MRFMTMQQEPKNKVNREAMTMKRIIGILSIIIILAGGIVPMAFSTQNIKSVNRKIIYKEESILKGYEIFDVNGTTYVPLRALCENTRKEVEWVEKTGEVIIRDEQWDYSDEHTEKFLPYIPSEIAVPDAETAFQIADIMFRTSKGDDYYYKARGPEFVAYDERYKAWVVPGEIVFEKKGDEFNFDKDVPTVIVLRKDNGEVIAFW